MDTLLRNRTRSPGLHRRGSGCVFTRRLRRDSETVHKKNSGAAMIRVAIFFLLLLFQTGRSYMCRSEVALLLCQHHFQPGFFFCHHVYQPLHYLNVVQLLSFFTASLIKIVFSVIFPFLLPADGKPSFLVVGASWCFDSLSTRTYEMFTLLHKVTATRCYTGRVLSLN